MTELEKQIAEIKNRIIGKCQLIDFKNQVCAQCRKALGMKKKTVRSAGK